jgi:uncharacterized membrane protein YeaQ/YmgE (transglycosylase-associated protein family)
MNLTIESLIILLIVSFLVGWIGQTIAGYSHRGCLTSTALGFIGAVIGSWAVKQFKLPPIWELKVGNTNFPVVWAIIGAALVVAILGLLTRRRIV